jgi:epithelial splicing regulatory protein 1/2
MLQLVGRHEMDKVQLQHESETVLKNGTDGTNGMSAQLNGLNAAALALQALAAANPALLLNQNPWLAQHMQLLNGMPGQTGQGGAAMAQNAFAAHMQAQQQGAMPAMEAAQFAAHQLAGQHLSGAAGMAGLTQQLNGFNLLQQQAGVPTSAAHVAPPQDPTNGWLPNGAPDNMMFYHNSGTNGAWADPRRMSPTGIPVPTMPSASQWAAVMQQSPSAEMAAAFSAGFAAGEASFGSL